MSESSDVLPAQIIEHFTLALDKSQAQIEEVKREIDEKTSIFEELQKEVKHLGAVFQDLMAYVEDSKRGFKESERQAQDVMVAVLRLRNCLKNFTGSDELQ